MIHGFWKKLSVLVAVFSLLTNSFTVTLKVQPAYAQEATPSATDSISTAPTPEPPPQTWQIRDDGSAQTLSEVVLNQEYQSPQNSKVKVKFSKLPDLPGKLVIKEVKLSPEQLQQTKALSDTAYDITSTMENGTFEYILTLPTPTIKNVEVKASEDGKNFTTLGGVTTQSDTVTITGLDHFTLFVLVPTGTAGVTITDSADTSVADNYIKQDFPNNNFGGDGIAEIKSGSGIVSRMLLKFDLTPISAGSTISSATLKLHMSLAPTSGQSLEVYKVSSQWNEGVSMWSTNNSTWNNRATGTAWASPGGDFTGSPVTASVGTVSDNWVTWDVTSLVQSWYSEPSANFGFLIKNANEGVYSRIKLDTRENVSLDNRPRLEVNFTTLAANNTPTITLAAPNGAEVLTGGNSSSITWLASDSDTGDELTINLEYTTDGISFTPIASSLTNSGSYSWTTPEINSTTVKVKATVSDGSASFEDLSDSDFTINTPTPTPTPTTTPAEIIDDPSTSQTTSSSNNTGDSGSTPICGDAKPASAPILLGAVSSAPNEVTLTWSKADDPVTYYLISYGLSSGVPQFGNPDVGNKEITSYTVKNLSAGVTYYFHVRAGNGCMPGDYSNELSATPGGLILNSQAEGFIEGVLGVAFEGEQINSTFLEDLNIAEINTEINEEQPGLEPTVAGETSNNSRNPFFPLFLIIALIFAFRILSRKLTKSV